jgi:[ribosomal protein S5]-alanine N-acetyltransferase
MTALDPTLHSERLDLRLMTLDFFAAASNGDQAQAAQLLGVPLPAEWWPVSHYTLDRVAQARQNPALQPWLERAIVLRSTQTMIGYIAFHMAREPEPLRPLGPGGVEFGYTIFAPFRGQGYATEASRALMTWAQQQGVRRFVLTIRPDNQPSLRIAARLGFHKIGSQMDDEDGLEDIYELIHNPCHVSQLTTPTSGRGGSGNMAINSSE